MSGKLTLISSATASDSASVEFTSGIDSTYDEYQFWFVDISQTGSSWVEFSFQANASGGSGFNETITSTFFWVLHQENDASASIEYQTGYDQAQGTSYQPIAASIGQGADECAAGVLHLYSPSSTSKVKHFTSRSNWYDPYYSIDGFSAGYINTTSAIDEIAFKMNTGNILAGNIYLFGVS
jgi:hypothetical protein